MNVSLLDPIIAAAKAASPENPGDYVQDGLAILRTLQNTEAEPTEHYGAHDHGFMLVSMCSSEAGRRGGRTAKGTRGRPDHALEKCRYRVSGFPKCAV